MKAKRLTIDKLRTHKGLERLSDEEAEGIIKSLDALAGILFDHEMKRGIKNIPREQFIQHSEKREIVNPIGKIEPKIFETCKI